MDREQVHEAAQTAENLFPTIDQDGNQFLSKLEISDYIAKHPKDVNTDTQLKFLLDNFQLIENLEDDSWHSAGYTRQMSNSVGLSKRDLHTLDQLTSADGQGAQRLADERGINGTVGGGSMGLLAGVFGEISSLGLNIGSVDAVLDAIPSSVFVFGGLAAATALGVGIGYVVERERGQNYYDQKAREVSTLYK